MARIKDFVRLNREEIKVFRTHRLATEYNFKINSEEHLHACDIIDDARETFRSDSRVPVIKIDEHAAQSQECKSLDEVAEIFVRVNDGGTKLSRMDLIFSLMKSRWTKASEEIESLCTMINSKGEFLVTKDFIIRCLMVFSGRSAKYRVGQIRKSDLMEEFKNIFPRAKSAILSSFDFLTENKGGGIRTWRLLSGGRRADIGYNVMIPIAYFLYRRNTQEIPESEYRRFRRFLYISLFSRYMVRYVETRIDKIAGIIGKSSTTEFPINDCVKTMSEAEIFNHQHPDELLGRKHTLDPLLNILSGGSVDFNTLLDRNAPHRDHIFPYSKLKERGVDEEKINHFANMQLLGAVNNILKNKQDPEIAFSSFDPEVLLGDEYLIPKELLSYSKYDEFLDKRSKLIQERVLKYIAPSQI